MSTLIEQCNELARIFIQTRNKKKAAKIITGKIDSLIYSSSKQPIEFNLKCVMLQVIHELLSGKRPIAPCGNKVIRVKQKDVLRFAKLENYILRELWYKHELKQKEVVEIKQPRVAVKTFTFTFRSRKNSKFDLGAL